MYNRMKKLKRFTDKSDTNLSNFHKIEPNTRVKCKIIKVSSGWTVEF